MFEKDEINRKLDEDNITLIDQVKYLQIQLENMGENRNNFEETLEQERIL